MTFNVVQLSYLQGLNSPLPTIDLDAWKDYLRAHLLAGRSGYLDQNFIDATNEYSKALGILMKQPPPPPPLQEQAVSFLTASADMLLGKQYIANYFNIYHRACDRAWFRRQWRSIRRKR